MKTIIRKIIGGIIFSILYCCHLSAQTPVYYYYDAAGNRNLRTITLQKSAKVDSSALVQANNEKNHAFQDNIGDVKILIYPNPTKGQLNIDIDGAKEGSVNSFYLFSLSGNILISKSSVASSSLIDLSKYPIGTYILKIVIGDKKTEWKIIKE